jgi:hypothetical protein
VYLQTGEVIMAINTAAYGMYPHDVALQQVVQTLNQSGFGKEDICMMVSPKHPLAMVVREARILNAERGASAAAGMMAWLMKLGAVMIPTVGLFIRSQAFFKALMATKDSSPYGNSSGLVELGFSAGDAERFENELSEMGVLVYITCPGKGGTTRAMEVLRRTGAHETATLEQETCPEAALEAAA